MKTMLAGATLLMALLAPQVATAYDLGTMCKAVDGWQVEEGTCDNQGRLQGKGAAYFARQVVFYGNYVDGLPDGPQDMALSDGLGSSLKGRERFAGKRHCLINFAKGEVTNSELVCTTQVPANYGRPEHVASLRVAPGAGKVAWTRLMTSGNGRQGVQLRIDLPQLDVSGDVNIDAAGLDLRAEDARFSGPAESFLLTIDDRGTNFLFKMSIQNMTTSVKTQEVAATRMKSPGLEFSGTFSFNCDTRDRCDIPRYGIFTSEPVDGKIDARSLTRLTLNDKDRYEMVPLHVQRDLDRFYNKNYQRVIYFKGPDGVVFDSTASRNCGADVGADIMLKGSNMSRVKAYDFRPVCGKVTTPNGQSFDGNFDRYGKPILQ